MVDSLANAPNAGAAADDARNVGTSLMVDAAHGSRLFGLFIVSGDWLPARLAGRPLSGASPRRCSASTTN